MNQYARTRNTRQPSACLPPQRGLVQSAREQFRTAHNAVVVEDKAVDGQLIHTRQRALPPRRRSLPKRWLWIVWDVWMGVRR